MFDANQLRNDRHKRELFTAFDRVLVDAGLIGDQARGRLDARHDGHDTHVLLDGVVMATVTTRVVPCLEGGFSLYFHGVGGVMRRVSVEEWQLKMGKTEDPDSKRVREEIANGTRPRPGPGCQCGGKCGDCQGDRAERQWSRGNRAAWASMLQTSLGHLCINDGEDPSVRVARLELERERAVAALRMACDDFGDNDWETDLCLADVIDKHLVSHLQEGRGAGGDY